VLYSSAEMAVTDEQLRSAAERRRTLAEQKTAATAELKALCLQAIAEGKAKYAVARATGVSRTTLDAWAAER
jgi:hypothetical protein